MRPKHLPFLTASGRIFLSAALFFGHTGGMRGHHQQRGKQEFQNGDVSRSAKTRRGAAVLLRLPCCSAQSPNTRQCLKAFLSPSPAELTETGRTIWTDFLLSRGRTVVLCEFQQASSPKTERKNTHLFLPASFSPHSLRHLPLWSPCLTSGLRPPDCHWHIE